MEDRMKLLPMINRVRRLALRQARIATDLLVERRGDREGLLEELREEIDQADTIGEITELWTVEGYFEDNEDDDQIGPWKYLCWVESAEESMPIMLTKQEMVSMLVKAGIGELRACLALNQAFPWTIMIATYRHGNRAYLEEL